MKVIRVIYWSALTCCCIFVILMTFKNGRGIAPPDKKARLRMKPVPDTAISAKGIAGHSNVPGGAERVKDTPNITRQHEETLCAVAPLWEKKDDAVTREKLFCACNALPYWVYSPRHVWNSNMDAGWGYNR